MDGLIKVLIFLSGLAFILAIVQALVELWFGYRFFVRAEGFSRVCSNLALIAIALTLYVKREQTPS
jgi:type III secretory pathway component EscR